MIKRIKKWIKKKFSVVRPVYIETVNEECLKGRIALITGGSSGIGKAIAKHYVKSGAKVILTGRNEDKLKTVVSEIGDNAKYYVLDNQDVDRYSFAFEEMNRYFGNIDILVNNAGIIGKNN